MPYHDPTHELGFVLHVRAPTVSIVSALDRRSSLARPHRHAGLVVRCLLFVVP